MNMLEDVMVISITFKNEDYLDIKVDANDFSSPVKMFKMINKFMADVTKHIGYSRLIDVSNYFKGSKMLFVNTKEIQYVSIDNYSDYLVNMTDNIDIEPTLTKCDVDFSEIKSYIDEAVNKILETKKTSTKKTAKGDK